MNFEVGIISVINNTIMALFFLVCIVITWDELKYSKFEIRKDKLLGIGAIIVLSVLFLWTLKAISEGLGL